MISNSDYWNESISQDSQQFKDRFNYLTAENKTKKEKPNPKVKAIATRIPIKQKQNNVSKGKLILDIDKIELQESQKPNAEEENFDEDIDEKVIAVSHKIKEYKKEIPPIQIPSMRKNIIKNAPKPFKFYTCPDEDLDYLNYHCNTEPFNCDNDQSSQQDFYNNILLTENNFVNHQGNFFAEMFSQRFGSSQLTGSTNSKEVTPKNINFVSEPCSKVKTDNLTNQTRTCTENSDPSEIYNKNHSKIT